MTISLVDLPDHSRTTRVRDRARGRESAQPGTCRCDGGCGGSGAAQEDGSDTASPPQRSHTLPSGALPRGVTEPGVCRVQNQG